jgi:hypothetical protein
VRYRMKGVMVSWDMFGAVPVISISVHHGHNQDCFREKGKNKKLASGLKVKELDS